MALNTKKAFTISELVFIVAILGLLAGAIAILLHMKSREQAQANVCQINRGIIERSEAQYFMEKDGHSANLQDLADAGYLKIIPKCPANGVYAWVPAAGSVPAQSQIGCSVHGEVAAQAAKLTSLGSTFKEITGAMTSKIAQFYKSNGKYPRSFGDYVFTDIGLDPNEWKKSYDGIFYNPGGSRLKVTPADGYRMTMTDLKGKQQTLTSSLKWSLWYDMNTKQWYYHSIASGNEIDINLSLIHI